MNSESEINTTITSIERDQWQTLFDLIPNIKETKSYGEFVVSDEISEGVYTFPHISSADIVNEFVRIVQESNPNWYCKIHKNEF